MRAIVKGISNDVFDINTYQPKKSDNFYLNLRVRIGLESSQGADDFELFVCTPKWLDESLWEPRLGRGMLIVREYSLKEIEGFIYDCVSRSEGASWADIAMKLGRVFSWEFDDYQV
ncbi:immunity 8 family protein [Pseudomonas lactis]